ncbi:Midasin [Camellia lanceoleosa]|uniref:Midasin n=1 Tax=Camellia lanceoleosa TaxID=1840588 RepID=A0ACC0HPB6_9ERIC|nr:Midasin [Camellia lanceoleosa]
MGTANQYYFRSMALVYLLQQICLNFHNDFTLEQVNRSGSFLDHLMVIQQEQRAAAYSFVEHLGHLRKCVSLFENLLPSSLASDTPNDEQDDLNEVPGKDAKDDEDGQLESAMGETGDDGEIIDEKLWDKDDEENPNSAKDKYESGPSVKDTDSSGRELRAKEDSDSATPADEAGELNPNELDKQEAENENQDDLDNSENLEDMNMDKEEAFADQTC